MTYGGICLALPVELLPLMYLKTFLICSWYPSVNLYSLFHLHLASVQLICLLERSFTDLW